MATDPEIRVGDDGELEYEYEIESDDFKSKRKPHRLSQRRLRLFVILPLATLTLFLSIVLLLNIYTGFLCIDDSCRIPLEMWRERQIHEPVPPLSENVECYYSPCMSVHDTVVEHISQLCDTPVPAGTIMLTTGANLSSEIYLIREDGSNLCRLTNNSIWEMAIAWSPDRTKIAFTSMRATDDRTDVYVMNVDGSDLHNLTSDRAIEGNVVWSPDGTQLAYTSDRDDLDVGIVIVNVDGSDRRTLTNYIDAPQSPRQRIFDEDLSWSPDGRKIVFTSYYRNPGTTTEIYTVDVVTGLSSIQRITNNIVYENNVHWLPDGLSIIYESRVVDSTGYNNGFAAIFSDLSGQNRQVLELGSGHFWALSPDGQKILVTRGRWLYVANLDGEIMYPILKGTIDYYNDMEWR